MIISCFVTEIICIAKSKILNHKRVTIYKQLMLGTRLVMVFMVAMMAVCIYMGVVEATPHLANCIRNNRIVGNICDKLVKLQLGVKVDSFRQV